MENKMYIEPKMEITMFDSEDVITTSGGNIVEEWRPVGGGNGIVLPDDEW